MICVPKSLFPVDCMTIRKDVKIGELLTLNEKDFKTTEEAYMQNYVPVDFCTSIRSIYDNTVIQIQDEHKFRWYYQNMVGIPVCIHKGYDLVMYVSSLAMLSIIDYWTGFEELMARHSQFQCIGLYNPSPDFVNPIIYSHIILSDIGMRELEPHLSAGNSVVKIKDIKPLGNINHFIDTLIEVKKEESTDE